MISINKNDLQDLNYDYHNTSSSLHFIYGASKSGKTTLIKDFVVKKNYIYFSFSLTSKSIAYRRLAHIVNQKFKLKNSLHFFKEFDDILNLIFKENIQNKLSIILDNFHELLKVDKYALDILFENWEKKLKNKNLQIIILSSSLYNKKYDKKLLIYKKNSFFMENIPFENISTIKNISIIDKLYIYSFFGTSNYLLDFYDYNNDFIKNVYKISLLPSSPFFSFGFDYLKRNIQDIATYCSILYAISKGSHKIGDISNFIDIKASHLSRYMQKLQDLFIVKKLFPIDDNFKNSKYGRFYIKDNFLKFWFFYVFDNLSYLEMKKHNSVLKQINNTFIKSFIQESYKEYIFELILKDPKQYLGFIPLKIGKWWDNSNEIDLIAYNEKEITFISILWDNTDKAKLHYGILKSISDNYKTTLKRNYIIISKNTYINMNKE